MQVASPETQWIHTINSENIIFPICTMQIMTVMPQVNLGGGWEWFTLFCRKCCGAMQWRYFQLWLNGGRNDFPGQKGFSKVLPHT